MGFRAFLLAFFTTLFAGTADAQTQTALMGCCSMGPAPVVAGATYSGPGDVVSGAKVWLGLRAYNAAAAAAQAKAVKLVRTNGDTCDLLVALTGGLGNTANCSISGQNNTTPAAWCTASTCKITILYDQSGNVDDFTPNAGHEAILAFSCIGSLPCADFTSGTAFYGGATTDTVQPFTTSAVVIRTGAFTSQNDLFVIANGTFYDAVVNQVGGYFGNLATVTASDNTWHSIQIVINSTSSAVAVDATQTTGLNMGTNNAGASFWLGSQNSGGSNPLNGKLTEIGFWPVAFTGTQQTNVCHNQFAYWGTPTSC